MAKIEKILEKMRRNPAGIRFEDVARVCTHFFGEARNDSTSHHVYKMPWEGDPRVNIQRGKDGKAKAYQVKQVLMAIDKLEGDDNG